MHKPSGRELLDVNPLFQPANLAIRNVWFSGGVEWNIGIICCTGIAFSELLLTWARIYDIFNIVIVTTPENFHRDLAVLAAEKGTMSFVRRSIGTRNGEEVIAML